MERSGASGIVEMEKKRWEREARSNNDRRMEKRERERKVEERGRERGGRRGKRENTRKHRSAVSRNKEGIEEGE